jgi:predicted transcriptional regulator
VMSQDYLIVNGLTPVSTLVDEKILNGGHSYFFVQDGDDIRGMLTLKDLSEIPKSKWRFTTVEQAMVPISRMTTVQPDIELIAALRIMDNLNLVQMAVMVEGKLIGVLTREQVSRYLRMRAELRV